MNEHETWPFPEPEDERGSMLANPWFWRAAALMVAVWVAVGLAVWAWIKGGA
jgi:hypothetical protein